MTSQRPGAAKAATGSISLCIMLSFFGNGCLDSWSLRFTLLTLWWPLLQNYAHLKYCVPDRSTLFEIKQNGRHIKSVNFDSCDSEALNTLCDLACRVGEFYHRDTMHNHVSDRLHDHIEGTTLLRIPQNRSVGFWDLINLSQGPFPALELFRWRRLSRWVVSHTSIEFKTQRAKF